MIISLRFEHFLPAGITILKENNWVRDLTINAKSNMSDILNLSTPPYPPRSQRKIETIGQGTKKILHRLEQI